jgi:cytochrome c peroxidase
MNLRPLRLVATSLLFLACAGSSFAQDKPLAGDKQAFRRPIAIPFPDSAPYSPQLATLGKMLFFDPRLSGAQNLSCASCHNPSFGYEVPVPGAIGAANTPLGRKAPTILNAAFTPVFFWDGRAKSLEDQAQGPIQAAAEMNGNFHDIVPRLQDVPEYRAMFAAQFPNAGVTKENVLTAIATYERTIVTGWAPFDRWVDGDENAVSASAKHGFELFTGKAGCSGCHTGWNFTDNQFHDIGFSDSDIGRAKLEPNNPMAQHAFKTPGLRNLIYRAPFGHAGQMPNLESIIAFYESGGEDRPSKSPLIRKFSLDAQETRDLIAFLKSLTAEKTETALPNLPN